MVKLKNSWLIPLILLLAGLWPTPACAESPPAMQSVGDLWLDVRVLNQPLAQVFERLARPDDIARVEHVEDLPLLREVGVGRKLVVFKSAAEAEYFMPRIAGQVDIIGYNLEHGPANPRDEQADPVESARRMRALADQYGLQLAFGPDRRFALSHGVDIAPYVDIFVLQVQLVQRQPEQVYGFVLPLIPQLRRANPNLEISVQVRTEGDSQEDLLALVDLVDSIRDQDHNLSLDGVSVLTSLETVNNAEILIQALHNRQPTLSQPSTSAAQGPNRPAAEPQTPNPAQAAISDTQAAQIPRQAIMTRFLLTGAAVAGVIMALVYAAYKRRQ